MEKRFIYADNAATTQISQGALAVMNDIYLNKWGNPSSFYSSGRAANRALEAARKDISDLLGCTPQELYFTSCGSESDNWAIKGAAYASIAKGKHIITSAIEHHAVFTTLEALEKEGFEITYLPAHENGIVRPEELEAAMRDDTTLVAIIHANNEIGTVQPINELSEIAHKHKALFFTDAVQTVGKLKIDVKALGVDMLSFSAHKFHGPKGVGGLYIRKGIKIKNLIDGGGQERGKRSGTENVAGICGMAKALEEAHKLMATRDSLRKKRDYLMEKLLTIPHSYLNGDREKRLEDNINISFEYIEGESLILLLDMHGICASTGSACSSKSLEPSHVLLAIGLPHEIAHGSLRLTISDELTYDELDYIYDKTNEVVKLLRDMSPLYDRAVKEGTY